jgi:hypothetical protein
MDWEPVRALATATTPPVSREQRQEWRDEGKCVRCGSEKHWVKNCKHRPTRTRSSSISSTTSTNSKAKVRIGTVRVARTKTTAKPTGSAKPTGPADLTGSTKLSGIARPPGTE